MGEVFDQMHYDEGEDKLRIKRVQNVDAILEANKRQFEVDNKRYGKGDFHHVARIPMVAIENYCRTKGIKVEEFMNNEKLFHAFLNDPDNRMFRTKGGTI